MGPAGGPHRRFALNLLEEYRAKHQHPLNKATHALGIPMIVASLAVVWWDWRWGLALFVGGWILQFAGHAIEGNQPAFFKNPRHLIVGPLWLLRRALGLEKRPRP